MASRPEPHPLTPATLALVLAAVVALLLTAACKQGEGELCQVDSDCETGLLCVAVTGTCQTDQPDVQQDAAPTVDAGTPDAGDPDAEVPDAEVPDAAPPDAAPPDSSV